MHWETVVNKSLWSHSVHIVEERDRQRTSKQTTFKSIRSDQMCKRNLEGQVPGASVRNSAHGKGHEEGGLAYTKAWSSLRKPPVPEHLPQKPESIYFTVSCSCLHLWLYGGLFPTSSLREGVNLKLQVNKNSLAWKECFSLRTPLKVI